MSNLELDLPYVAVAMMTYNHESFIADAIESVVSQKTEFHIVLFIGEDCSTDNTRRICVALKEKYPDKIELLLNRINLGLMLNARQILGLCATIGAKYIALCEGDDYWIDPYKLQKQVDFLEANPDCSWCFHPARVVYEDRSRPDYIYKPKKIPSTKKFETKDVILRGGGFYSSPSAMFVADAIKDIPKWYVKAPAGDFLLALIASQKGTIGYLDDVMCVYRMKVNGSWTERVTKDWATLSNFYEETEKYLRAYNEHSSFSFDKHLKRLTNDLRRQRLELALILPSSAWGGYSRWQELRNCCSTVTFSKKVVVCWHLVTAAWKKIVRKCT
jgi:glycosyltransferase involved in cell wall biosynthesis